MSRRRRSLSYSIPVQKSAPNSRSTSSTSFTHRLPLRSPPRQRRRTSRSPDYSPGRKISFSRSRSRSRFRRRLRTPVRHADYNSPPRRRNHAKHKSPEICPRRRLSRSFSRDRYCRSRSRAKKPLVAKKTTAPIWNTISTETSSIQQDSDLARTMGRGSESLEPGEVSVSEFVHSARLVHPLLARPSLKFASSLAVCPPQHANVPEITETTQKGRIGTTSTSAVATTTDLRGGLLGPSDDLRLPKKPRPNGNGWGMPDQPGPSDSDMEVDDYLQITKNPVTSQPVNAEVTPVAYNLNGYISATEDLTFAQVTQPGPNEMTYPAAAASRDPRLARPSLQGSTQNHSLRSSGKSKQGNLHERIQELAQAFTSMVKSKMDSEFQGRLASGDEDAAQSGSKPDFQAYGDSAMRRCERMISAIVNDVLLQVKVKSGAHDGHMQGIEQTCSRCDSLEQRINVLEKQKLDEAALMTRMEEKMEKRMEQVIEARAVKSVRPDNSEAILPPTKRRRLDISLLSTSLFSNEEPSEQRLTKLESTVSKWEKRLKDAMAVGDNAAVRPGDMMDRVSALEGDSKQVFGYLSVHDSALVSLNSALSLDPSKPLGQGLHLHLSNLRTEMAHMLTDVFGSLEDSLARVIVGVIIKQTKLEMQAGYDTFTRELLGKIVPEALTKGKEPALSPTMPGASASMLASGDLKHTIAAEIVLPAIRELPSMRK